MNLVPSDVTHMPFLFVYGTLMRGLGESWQERLGARFVGRGSVRAKLYDVAYYPGAVSTRTGSPERVKGELYELASPEQALRTLDEYEEFFPLQPERSLFVRKIVPVTLDDGTEKKAWVYLYNGEVHDSRQITSGDYRDKVVRTKES